MGENKILKDSKLLAMIKEYKLLKEQKTQIVKENMVLKDALLDMLDQYGYNYALSAVQNACKVLGHPIQSDGKCFCRDKKGTPKDNAIHKSDIKYIKDRWLNKIPRFIAIKYKKEWRYYVKTKS